MSLEVLRETLGRIRDHMLAHGISKPHLVLHGGEPLLIGKARFEAYLTEVRSILKGYDPVVSLQSNGLLIDDGWLQLFKHHQVTVGISFDGTPLSHDKLRVNHGGRGTSQKTILVIKLLQERAEQLFAGILCVVDPLSSGKDTVNYLIGLGIKSFDLLLPEANWQVKPRVPISPFLKDAFALGLL